MDHKPETSFVVDELKRLDGQIDSVHDLTSLKPIFYRLEEVTRDYPDDFDVQMRVSDIKQHLMNRGMQLKQEGAVGTATNPIAHPSAMHGVAGSGMGVPPPVGMPPAPGAPGMPPSPPGTQGMPPLPSGMPPPPAMGPSGFATGAAPVMGSDPYGSQPPYQPSNDPFAASSIQPQVYVPPVRNPTPPPIAPVTPEPPAGNTRKAVLIGGGIGLLLVLILLGVMFYLKRKPTTPVVPPPAATVPIDVATNPPGADVKVNDQVKCKANCKVDLEPGQYSLSAVLPGYDPALQTITVEKGHPLSLNLALTPQASSLKILTDLSNGGKVTLDGQPAGALQDGQIVLDHIAPGQHELKIVGDKGGEAKFTFVVAPGAAPAIQGPIATKNLTAVVASSLGTHIHVGTSATPMKVSLDGKAIGDAGPDGIDLKDVAAGDHELTLNDGKEDRKLTVTATPSPVLTAWINSSASGGILVVNAGEDGATVMIDGKAYPRKTRRGQLWVPNLAPKDYAIKVVKPGFQDVPVQKATVTKGAETRLAFKMQAIPQIAVLKITGGIAGAEVLIDKLSIGKVEGDGSLSYSNVTPGDHSIEIRREQYSPKTLSRTFGPGATVELSGDNVAMERASGNLKLTVTPANAQVTIKRSDEARANPIVAGSHPLPVGSYTLVAKAAGYTDSTMNVQVRGGDFVIADLKLVKEGAAAITKPASAKASWEHPNEWQTDEGWQVHRGGNFVPYSAQPSTGMFTFACQLMKGGVFQKHIQWRVGVVDDKNYVHFQIDKKSLQSKIVTNGKSVDRPKIQLDAQEPYTMQIEITPDTIIHRIREGEQWVTIDRLTKPGADQGKFGFFIPGKDEIGISGFSFTPR